MRPLNKPGKIVVGSNIEELKPIPANLRDAKGQVHEDKLFAMYTLRTLMQDQKIHVEFVVSDLVKHYKESTDDEPKYWVGLGLPSTFLKDSEVYAGYGVPVLDQLGDPVENMEIQVSSNLKEYKTVYFDVEKAIEFKNLGYIIIRKDDTVSYYYELDFSHITRKAQEVDVQLVNWKELSVEKVKKNYLFGIDLSDAHGNPLPESLFTHYINSAVEYIQNLLDIVIAPTEVNAERHDYVRSDYQNWGFIQLHHKPIREVKAVRLMYGNRTAIEIPNDWLQVDKLTGQVTLFPSAGSASNLIIGQTGMIMGLSSMWQFAPRMWEVDYVAGIDETDKTMPVALLEEAINKRASCGILSVWGDLIIGAGIASQSVSIDGISQSIGTTQSAMYGGASARIDSYTKDLKSTILPALTKKFMGIRMIVV